MRTRSAPAGGRSAGIRRLSWAFRGVVIGAIAGVLGSAVGAAQSADDPAEPIFTRMCVKCHTPERIVNDRRTRAQWEEVIDQMATKGATGTDEEFDSVLDYLLRRHGRVNINTATAADMVIVLAIPAGQADAIVGYRKTNGAFEDFDALAKTPGIDVDRLSHERDALSF